MRIHCPLLQQRLGTPGNGIALPGDCHWSADTVAAAAADALAHKFRVSGRWITQERPPLEGSGESRKSQKQGKTLYKHRSGAKRFFRRAKAYRHLFTVMTS
ncbi:MAG: hypothetical protein PHE53_13060 [Thermoguttaceae bacterium]|nr:hypothetical protein [Thermoguttaceae bacterium]